MHWQPDLFFYFQLVIKLCLFSVIKQDTVAFSNYLVLYQNNYIQCALAIPPLHLDVKINSVRPLSVFRFRQCKYT